MFTVTLPSRAGKASLRTATIWKVGGGEDGHGRRGKREQRVIGEHTLEVVGSFFVSPI